MRNILFIRSDRFGEFLLSLPAVKLVKDNYPQSKIYLLARKNNLSLVRDVDFIDYLLEYRPEVFSGYRGAFKLARLLKAESIDTVVVLNPKKEVHLACLLAGSAIRVGYRRKWGFCLNRKIDDKKHDERKHEIEYNIDLVKLICGNTYIPDVDLKLKVKIDTEHFRRLFAGGHSGAKSLVIHPFTSDKTKKIDIRFWRRLSEELKNKVSQNIAVIGSQEEKKEAQSFAEELKIRNLAGDFSLPELAVFLKEFCGVFIGLDSGPLHLASLLDIPSVGLFKVTSSVRWGPFGCENLVVEEKDADGFADKIGAISAFVERQNGKSV